MSRARANRTVRERGRGRAKIRIAASAGAIAGAIAAGFPLPPAFAAPLLDSASDAPTLAPGSAASRASGNAIAALRSLLGLPGGQSSPFGLLLTPGAGGTSDWTSGFRFPGLVMNSGANQQTLGISNALFHFNMVGQAAASPFSGFPNFNGAPLAAGRLSAGMSTKSLSTGLDLAPGRSLNFSSSDRASATQRFSSQGENLQWDKAASLGFTQYTAKDSGGSAAGSDLQLALGKLKLSTSDLNIASGFTSFANSGLEGLTQHSGESGIGRHTLDLAFTPGARDSLAFNRLNISDAHGAIERQNLALNLGGFSLTSSSQSVAAGFANSSHLADPAEKLLATRELGVSQNAFAAKYAAGKTTGLSFASDVVSDKAGSVRRAETGLKAGMVSLDIRQLDVSRGFKGAAGVNSAGVAGAATTPGLSARTIDLALQPAKNSSLTVQQVQASDAGGALSSSELTYKRGANLLLEIGQRETGAGFKSFNAGLGFAPLAAESGTRRSDIRLRVGAPEHNFIDTSYTSLTGLTSAGAKVAALSLAVDPTLAPAASAWEGVGELAAASPGAAAAPGAVAVPTSATLFGAGVQPHPAGRRDTLAAGSSIRRVGLSFGDSPGRDTRVEGSFVSFTNGLAFQSQGHNIRGISLSLKQTLGKDSSLAIAHNSLEAGSDYGVAGRSSVDSVAMKLNTVGGVHLTSDYFSQKLPDRNATSHGNLVLADGSLHLDAHFSQALNPSGHEVEIHSGDIQYAVARNFTFHLQNNNGGTHLMSDSLGTGVAAPASTTPPPPRGAVQHAPGTRSAPPFLGGQVMGLQRIIGGGALGLVFFHGADPDSVGIGGQQFSYATSANPSLPLHLQATINRVGAAGAAVPVKRLQLSYAPVKKVTFTTSLDENRLMPDGKVLNGERTEYTITTPNLTLAALSEDDSKSHHRADGDSLQFHSRLYRGLGLKASLTRNPETPAGLIQHAVLRQVEIADGPFTSFYRESKPLVGRIGVTRGITGTWRLARSWNINAGVTDDPLDLAGNVVRGESQTLGINGLLFNGIKFRFDRLGGIVDPITHLRVHSTQLELTGTVPGLGTFNGAYRSDLTAGDSTNWMWTEFTKMGLDPATMLQQRGGELRGDVYALNYVLPSKGAVTFNVDGALIHQSNAAYKEPDTTVADFKVGLTATF